jgi:hypothetical protein
MFLVFEILSSQKKTTPGAEESSKEQSTRKKKGKQDAEEEERDYSNGDEPEDARRRADDLDEEDATEDDEDGREVARQFSGEDEDLAESGGDEEDAIHTYWFKPEHNWNPKEKNARGDTMAGKYNSFTRLLIKKHTDCKLSLKENEEGIRFIMHTVQTHKSFGKLGGMYCHEECPEELAAFTKRLYLEEGLHGMILERLRNYRAAASRKGKSDRAARVKKLLKRYNKSKEANGRHKMSTKDQNFIADAKRETDAAAEAKTRRKSKADEKAFQVKRRALIKKVHTHTHTTACA